MKSSLLLVSVFFISSAFAQLIGTQRFEQFGVGFTIPEGWVGQENDESITIRNPQFPTVVAILSLHESSAAELLSEAKARMHDEYGTSLDPTSTPKLIGKNRVDAHFKGTIEMQSCEGVYHGLSSPYGYGLSILGIAFYGTGVDEAQELTKALSSSVNFFQVKKMNSTDSQNNTTGNSVAVATNAKEWREQLAGSRLTFMESYSSSGSGGYSLRKEIDLCAAGYFSYEGASLISVSTSGAGSYSNKSGTGDGQWKVSQRGKYSLLVLNFYDGRVAEFYIEYKDKKLYLSGESYFWTWSGDNAPYCPE